MYLRQIVIVTYNLYFLLNRELMNLSVNTNALVCKEMDSKLV